MISASICPSFDSSDSQGPAASSWRWLCTGKHDEFHQQKCGFKQHQLLKMTIEIVNFPMNTMVIFNSYVKLPEGTWNITITSISIVFFA
jgi:hypothetical protein